MANERERKVGKGSWRTKKEKYREKEREKYGEKERGWGTTWTGDGKKSENSRGVEMKKRRKLAFGDREKRKKRKWVGREGERRKKGKVGSTIAVILEKILEVGELFEGQKSSHIDFFLSPSCYLTVFLSPSFFPFFLSLSPSQHGPSHALCRKKKRHILCSLPLVTFFFHSSSLSLFHLLIPSLHDSLEQTVMTRKRKKERERREREESKRTPDIQLHWILCPSFPRRTLTPIFSISLLLLFQWHLSFFHWYHLSLFLPLLIHSFFSYFFPHTLSSFSFFLFRKPLETRNQIFTNALSMHLILKPKSFDWIGKIVQKWPVKNKSNALRKNGSHRFQALQLIRY